MMTVISEEERLAIREEVIEMAAVMADEIRPQLRDNEFTRKQYAEHEGCSRKAARSTLSALVEAGKYTKRMVLFEGTRQLAFRKAESVIECADESISLDI